MSGRGYLMLHDYQISERFGEPYYAFEEFIRESGAEFLPHGFIYEDPPRMMIAIEGELPILERILSQLKELSSQLGIPVPSHELRETLPEGERILNFFR